MLFTHSASMCPALFMICSLFLLIAPATAMAKQVALVIGNGSYEYTRPLPNPIYDARALGNELTRLGFEVEVAQDLDRTSMGQALQRFARKMVGAEVALFFYAGHGLQIEARNYLVPIKAKLANVTDIDKQLVDVQRQIASMQNRAKVLLVFLDACRNNPIAEKVNMNGQAVGRGLAEMNFGGKDILIAYATSPGQVASDGKGLHSPFTKALLQHIGTRGVELQAMLLHVTKSVRQLTDSHQSPWVHGSLDDHVYLAGQPLSSGAADAADLNFWNAVKDSNDPADLMDYVHRYPGGHFVSVARRRYESLAKKYINKPRGPTEDQTPQRGGQSSVETVVTPDY